MRLTRRASVDTPEQHRSPAETPDNHFPTSAYAGGTFAHPSRPAIGSLLRITPDEYERAFWSNWAADSVLQSRDGWATAILLAFNCLYFVSLQHLILLHAAAQYTVLIACNVGQLAWLVFAPASYGRLRQHIVLLHRLMRAALVIPITRSTVTILLPLTAAAASHHASALPRNSGPTAATPPTHASLSPLLDYHRPALLGTQQLLPPWLDTMRLAFIFSGSYASLVYAAALPLQPVALQGALQLLTLWLLASYSSPTALRALHLHTRRQEVVGVCQGLNVLLELFSMGLLGVSPSSSGLDQRCQQSPHAMLLLFTELFAVVMLPIYIAYQVEGHQKAAFLKYLARGMASGALHMPPAGGLAGPSGVAAQADDEAGDQELDRARQGLLGRAAARAFVVAGHLLLMALQSWVLALKMVPLLERHAGA